MYQFYDMLLAEADGMRGTAGGCRYGKRCRFLHEELDDKASRCWHCSSTQHLESACPYHANPRVKRMVMARGRLKEGRKEERAKGKGP